MTASGRLARLCVGLRTDSAPHCVHVTENLDHLGSVRIGPGPIQPFPDQRPQRVAFGLARPRRSTSAAISPVHSAGVRTEKTVVVFRGPSSTVAAGDPSPVGDRLGYGGGYLLVRTHDLPLNIWSSAADSSVDRRRASVSSHASSFCSTKYGTSQPLPGDAGVTTSRIERRALRDASTDATLVGRRHVSVDRAPIPALSRQPSPPNRVASGALAADGHVVARDR